MKHLLCLIILLSLSITNTNAQCNLSNLTYDELLCENDGLIVFYGLDFDTLEVGSAYQIFIDGELQYSSFPYVLPIAGIEFDCPGAEEFNFKICDLDNNDCCVEIVIEHPCFDICDGCSIYEFYNNTELECIDGQMIAEWYIHSENTSETGYDIFIEDEFLTFLDYVPNDGPYYFDIPAVDTEFASITACDNDNPDCCFTWEFINPCFEPNVDCQFTQFETDSEFQCAEPNVPYGTWLIGGEGLSETSFNVYLEGEFLWNMNYEEDGTYETEFEVGNTQFYTITICDAENPNCCITSEFLNPCYEPEIECLVYEPTVVGVLECISEEVVFGTWSLDGENLDGAGFTISINNEELYTLPFNFSNEYTMEFFVDDTEYFTMQVCTDGNSDCCFITEFMNPCFQPSIDCEITLFELQGNSLECDSGGNYAFGNFLIEGVGTSNVDFDFSINGNYQYSLDYNPDNIYELEFEVGTELEIIIIQVCDGEDETCCVVLEFINPCYEPAAECNISNLTLAYQECDSFEEYYIELDFDFVNVGNSGFQVWSTYASDTFQYEDLPVLLGPIPGYCDQSMDFEISDIDNPECVEFLIPFLQCCENQPTVISNLEGSVECNEDETFELTVTFEDEESSSLGYMISVRAYPLIGDMYLFGPFDFTGTNIQTVSIPEIANCQDGYKISVYDILEGLNPTSNVSTDIEACCDSPECNIISIDFNQNPICENNQIVAEWFIFAENTSEVGFDIFINDEFLTFIDYDGEGPYDFDIPNPETQLLTITACDNDNPDCCYSWELENPCFEDNNPDCEISELNADILTCEEGLFDVQINFEYTGVGQTFELTGNGENYGIFSYSNLPIILTDLVADCETDYEFIAVDQENEDCSNFAGTGIVCCDEQECTIFSIDFGPNPICENNQIVAEWFIFAENTSEVGFDIFINDEFLTFVDYNGEGPYLIDIPNPETEIYKITACDNDNADCCYSWELENPCFEDNNPDCEISELNTDILTCEEGLFDVQINFEYTGVGQTFELKGNGQSYGIFSYSNLPIILTDLAADCETDYEFIAVDQENENCSNFAGTGIVCCDEEECNIFSIDFGDNPSCENNQISTEWFIFAENTSEVGFDIFINDEFLTFVDYNGEGPYLIDIPNPETEIYKITACDNDNADCCYSWELENPCFETLTVSGITVNETGEDTYYFDLSFGDFDLPCDYSVLLDGELVDSIPQGAVSALVGPFHCDEEGIITVVLASSCSGDVYNFLLDLSEYSCITSVKDMEAEVNIQWFINSSILTINTNNEKAKVVELYNIAGQRILSEYITGTNKLNLSTRKNGLYVAVVKDENGRLIASEKIVILK